MIISYEVLPRAGGENLAVANNGLAVGVRVKGGLKQGLREPLIGII